MKYVQGVLPMRRTGENYEQIKNYIFLSVVLVVGGGGGRAAASAER